MSNTTTDNLIGLAQKFVGRSGFRIRTRRIGSSDTILVDVVEYSQSTSKDRAEKVAREAARLAGSQAKATLISDHESVKPVNRLNPDNGHRITSKTKVRSTTYMFKG